MMLRLYPTHTADCTANAPRTCHPEAAAAERVRGRLRDEWTGINSRAPALALLTTGLSGELLRAQLSTPAAPRKNADRRAAPKFICVWPNAQSPVDAAAATSLA